MRYYDSLKAAGYPISDGLTYEQDFQSHLDRGSAGGIDYAVGVGRPIYAPTKGRVFNRSTTGGGNIARFYHIDDNGAESGWYDEFLHLSSFGPNGAIFNPGEDIGARSGNSGTQTTGPHVHWHLCTAQGNRVRQWLYFREDPVKPNKAQELGRLEMIYIQCTETGITYLIGTDFISWPLGKDMANLAQSFGQPKPYAKTADVVSVAKYFGVPEDKVRNVPASRYWSKLDTIQPGGGATPAQIAAAVDASLKDDFAKIPKSVNDDVAKRMSS